MRVALGLAVLVAFGAFASCVTSELTLIGPRRPPRDFYCSVDVVPGTPAFPVVDVASVLAHCPYSEGQQRDCLEELRARACEVGADTIYGLTESLGAQGSGGQIRATLASRSQPGRPAPAAATAGASAACTPICSPGFDCQAGRCIPLCNPACAPTEICNGRRTCVPK